MWKRNIHTSTFHILSNRLLILLFFVWGCSQVGDRTPFEVESSHSKQYPEIDIDLPQIKERGKLIAITSYSSTSYFLYRGKPMGYEYELLNQLAEYLDLDLEIKVADNMNQIIDMLLKGEGDLISYGLTITRERQKKIKFTDYHTKTHQVLVQRKPSNWRQMKRHQIEEALIRDPLDLIGKTVHVRKNSSYYDRLQNLMDEIGGDINIDIVSGELETEELIKMVAEGDIDYTIADYNIAAINATYYDILDIKTSVSFNQRIAWAVRNASPELLKSVNQWIAKMRKTSDYYVIYNKYFKNRKDFRKRVGSDYFSKAGGKISKYDEIIKNKAQILDWDYRLLASIIYQESRFDPNAKSWAGAVGLMQIMPITAKQVGAKKYRKPIDNIDAGVKYLQELKQLFNDIPDSTERIKFILAAYNVGPNHVEDAQRLARKYNDEDVVWTNHVENWILKKAQSKYYNDDVVKYGYCRGSEPYQYVQDILERYNQYKMFIP
ncbi:MAG: transporter substrate-binding domain-containing protein [Bacteroidetes bacterium]|nr:transporter substrate-binding domain-containing protein [Bacteroidota bacterium]